MGCLHIEEGHALTSGDPAVIGGNIFHYEIVELLDRGETGELYKARDRRDGGLVALEILPAGRPPHAPEVEERLRREVAAATGLGHPHICPVLEVGGTTDGGLFVARAFC